MGKRKAHDVTKGEASELFAVRAPPYAAISQYAVHIKSNRPDTVPSFLVHATGRHGLDRCSNMTRVVGHGHVMGGFCVDARLCDGMAAVVHPSYLLTKLCAVRHNQRVRLIPSYVHQVVSITIGSN